MGLVEVRDSRVAINPNVYSTLRTTQPAFKEALRLCEGGEQFVSDVYHGTGSSIFPWLEEDGEILPYTEVVNTRRRKLQTGLRVKAGYPVDNSDNVSTSLYFTIAARQHALTYTNNQYPLVFGVNHLQIEDRPILPNRNLRAFEKNYSSIPLEAVSILYVPTDRLSEVASWVGNHSLSAKVISLEAVLFIFSIWEDFMGRRGQLKEIVAAGIEQEQRERLVSLYTGSFFNSIFHFYNRYSLDGFKVSIEEVVKEDLAYDRKNIQLFGHNEYDRLRRISEPRFFNERKQLLPSELLSALGKLFQ